MVLRNQKNDFRALIQTLLVTNFPQKNRLVYEIKQLVKEVIQFTKVFAIYFIFKNSKM